MIVRDSDLRLFCVTSDSLLPTDDLPTTLSTTRLQTKILLSDVPVYNTKTNIFILRDMTSKAMLRRNMPTREYRNLVKLNLSLQ